MRMEEKLWVLAQYSFHCTGVKYGNNPSYKLTTKLQARSSRIYAVRSILRYGSLSEGRHGCARWRYIVSSYNHHHHQIVIVTVTGSTSDYITEFNSLRKTMLEHLKLCGKYMYHNDIFCIRTQFTYALCVIPTINTVSLCTNTRLVFLMDRGCVVWEIWSQFYAYYWWMAVFEDWHSTLRPTYKLYL